mgnify:CR=1 FL=1
MNIETIIEEFLHDVCAGKRNETPTAYRSKLRRLAIFLDGREINQDEINAWRIDLLERDLSPWTVRSVIGTVRHFLRWGTEHGYWDDIKLRNIPEPEPEPKAIQVDTFERLLEATEMLDEWQMARERAILLMLRDSGCRVGALANLLMDGINWSGEFEAHDKGRWNIYAISPVTLDALSEWINHRRDRVLQGVEQVFIGKKGGPMRRIGIYRAINHLAEIAGIEERHNPHSFRHAFARDAIQAGADLSLVAAMLNHRGGSAVTGKYYARWNRKEINLAHHKFGPIRMMTNESAKP